MNIVTQPSVDNPATTSEKQATPNNKVDILGTGDIGPLFAKYALPMTLGMLINGLYNLVDTYFIAQYIGPAAMAGVSIVFPIQMIIFALAAMVSNGTSAIVSRCFGAEQFSKANLVVASAMSSMLCMAVLLPAIILPNMAGLFGVMGMNETLWPYAEAYLVPLVLGCVLMLLSSLINDLLRAEGKMGGLFSVILICAVTNTALDALFIAGFGWGVQGAAWATLLSIALGLVIGLRFFVGGQTKLNFPKPSLNWQPALIRDIVALGSPVFFSYLGAAMIIALVNFALANSSGVNGADADLAILIGAYGVLGRVNIFIIMPLIAISNAAQTIMAFNFGAGLIERVKKTLMVGIIVATVYLSVIAAIMLLLPAQVMGLFSDNMALVHQGAQIASILYIGFPLAGVGTISVALFQAMGRAKWAIFLSSAKMYLLLLPLILILPKLHGIEAIWWAFPLADSIMFVVVMTLLVGFWRVGGGFPPDSNKHS